MRRKIIKQKTAYTMTLPIKWIREHNISEKGEIDIEEEGNSLILSTESKPNLKEIDIDLETSDEEYCRIMIENHYLKGYDKIKVKYHDETTISNIQDIVANLIGMEIVEQKENKCIISETATPTTEEFKTLFKRTLSILKYSLEIVENSIENNSYTKGKEIEKMTKDARRFLLFLTRTIHKTNIVDKDEQSFLHLLLERLILIQHNQYYIYKKLMNVKTKNVKKEIKNIFKKAKSMFFQFTKQLAKEDVKLFSDISKEWKEIYFDHKQFVNCREEESIILYHSLHLSKLVFLVAQPNLSKEFILNRLR